MTNQLIIPFRGLDDNARPKSAALCYVYQSGTLTPVTVTDKDGTPLAWPVVADINGAWPQMFYAGALALKSVLKDADGVTLPGGTIDPVAVVTNVSTAAAIAFVPTDEIPETNLQDAVDAIGVKAAITAGTAVTITTPSGSPVIGLTPGALTQIHALSLVEGDLLYRGASTVGRLAKGTAGQVLRQNATAPEWGSSLAVGTAQDTTSGTSVDFTAIPAWVNRVTVMMADVSTNGTSAPLVQLGTSGGVVSTGYVSAAQAFDTGSTAVPTAITSTAGFILGQGSASYALVGALTLHRISGNVWLASGTFVSSGATTSPSFASGSVTLSGALDRIRITTVGGADTFDAGSVNLSWE